jgi:hypothetical protein
MCEVFQTQSKTKNGNEKTGSCLEQGLVISQFEIYSL